MAAERAIVICPVLPYPVVGGGHKRTLRLIEAIEDAGLTPHIVTSDGRDPAAAATLRERGWHVDVVSEPQQSAAARVRQHLRRLPSPYLPGVARRLGELVEEGCTF